MRAIIWALHCLVAQMGHGTNPTSHPRHVMFLQPNPVCIVSFFYFRIRTSALQKKISFFASLLNSFRHELPGMLTIAPCPCWNALRTQRASFKCPINCPGALFPKIMVLHPKEKTLTSLSTVACFGRTK